MSKIVSEILGKYLGNTNTYPETSTPHIRPVSVKKGRSHITAENSVVFRGRAPQKHKKVSVEKGRAFVVRRYFAANIIIALFTGQERPAH